MRQELDLVILKNGVVETIFIFFKDFKNLKKVAQIRVAEPPFADLTFKNFSI